MATGVGSNSAIRLSTIRSQIDKQQQVIAYLENRLQETILGGTDTNSGFGADVTIGQMVDQISAIYGENFDSSKGASYIPNGQGLTGSIAEGLEDQEPFNPASFADQDSIRQLLYQARALMGELRVEEQHWNGEVGEEKSRRKELGDMTKG